MTQFALDSFDQLRSFDCTATDLLDRNRPSAEKGVAEAVVVAEGVEEEASLHPSSVHPSLVDLVGAVVFHSRDLVAGGVHPDYPQIVALALRSVS